MVMSGALTYMGVREGNQTRFAMLKTMTRFLRALQAPSVEEIERAYLNGAATRYDLELREREVESGRFRRRLTAYA